MQTHKVFISVAIDFDTLQNSCIRSSPLSCTHLFSIGKRISRPQFIIQTICSVPYGGKHSYALNSIRVSVTQ